MGMEKLISTDIIDLTKDLIRFKTTHDNPDQILGCIDFIESFLVKNDIEFNRYTINGFPSILVIPGKKEFPVLLMSHIDVVDAPARLFEPVVRENKLFGRGSCDDKYAVALSLILFRDRLLKLRKIGKTQSDLDIGILITSDEEIGGENGAEPILRDIRPDFSIALDGGSLDKVIIKEKGLVRIKMISRGKSSHGSRPWLGENAIESLMDDYVLLKRFFAEQGVNHWNRTMNPGVIKGGNSVNQVPDYCELLLDIRYTENDDINTLLVTMAKQVKSELVVTKIDPVFFSTNSPYLDNILRLSKDIEKDCEHGASDARHLMKYGLDGVVWGANGNMSQHSLEEHVEIESILALYGRLDHWMDAMAMV